MPHANELREVHLDVLRFTSLPLHKLFCSLRLSITSGNEKANTLRSKMK